MIFLERKEQVLKSYGTSIKNFNSISNCSIKSITTMSFNLLHVALLKKM